ncbi:MAG: tRNA epoxyqueuosine(34) reductase QueG [Thermoanaerobaculia bacterium]
MANISQVWPELERLAGRLGALRVGVTPLVDEHVDVFEEWLERGYHASMAWLPKNLEKRRDPWIRFPWGKSVIVLTVPYSSERPGSPDSLAPHIARYAQGDDYHDVIDQMLREIETFLASAAPGAQTWRYVDTGPFSDRSLAVQAGLGWIGRNGMLIDPELGSWIFIGCLVTSLEPDLGRSEVADRCGNCTRCIEACPTDAILPGRMIDSNLCLSHATIELRGSIPPDIAARLEGNLFGCDICQEVCPWNDAPPPPHPSFEPRLEFRATPISDLLTMPQERFSTLFRRSAVKRARHAGLRRNAEALLQNQGLGTRG